jgi:hypothetical protein
MVALQIGYVQLGRRTAMETSEIADRRQVALVRAHGKAALPHGRNHLFA